MSLNVQSNSSTPPSTTTTTTTRSWSRSWSPELPSSTPMSSSFTSASTPLLPSLSTPSNALPPSSSFSPSPPPSTSAMTTSTTTLPSTTIPTTVSPGATISTTTTSITVTPTITLTTTTSFSTPTTPTISTTSPELSPTIRPSTTTTITTVIPPATSLSPITSTSASTPTMSSITSRSTSTSPGRSMTQTTSTTPTTPVVSFLTTPSPTPELMLSSPTRIGPVSTLSSTVFISTTNSRGFTTVYPPSFFTTTITFMTGGTTTTSTGTFANPTLNTDTSSPSSFFQNKGAVAGVFTLVGIALISIIIWIILFIRRRRREKGREHDTDILASLFDTVVEHRPMDPDTSTSSLNSRYDPFLAIPMPNPNSDGHRRSASGLLGNNSRRRTIMPDAYHEDRAQYDPYIEYGPRNSRDSYRDMPSPTTPHLNIPPSAFAPYRSSSDGMGMIEAGTGLPMGAGIVHARHSHHSSGSSFEPLLASHQRRNSLMPGRGPIVLDSTNLWASRSPSTDNASSASTSKPSYLPSLTHPNFYATNTSSHSAILINGQEDHGSEVNSVDANREVKKQSDVPVDSEVSTTDDEHESEVKKPVLAVRNLPDAASTLSLS